MLNFAVLALVSALISLPSGAVAQSTPLTADPAACMQQGGVVRKVCTDNSQCKGGCIYQSPGKPLPVSGRVKGVCKQTNDPCGCFSEVVKGKVSSGFCRD